MRIVWFWEVKGNKHTRQDILCLHRCYLQKMRLLTGGIIDSANGDFYLDDYSVGFMREQIRVPMLCYLRGVNLRVYGYTNISAQDDLFMPIINKNNLGSFVQMLVPTLKGRVFKEKKKC